MNIFHLISLVVALPLFCSIFTIFMKFCFKSLPKKHLNLLYLLSCAGVFALSIVLLIYTITYQNYTFEINKGVFSIQNLLIHFGFYLDNLSSVFLVTTSGFFFIAALFSYKYFRHNPQGAERFYIYLGFLQFFSICFFTSSNLMQSVIFMLFISILEYLFVNFYFQKPKAQNESKTIFEINVFADAILLFAATVFLYFSTLVPDANSVPLLGYNNINSIALYTFAGLNPLLFKIMCLLFVTGSLVKSSQFPFLSKIHLMEEAPNPVFTLFLTPVVLGAGIFLILRIFPVINLGHEVFILLKIVGIISAIIGACCALYETNIKKIMAFAAVSQIGLVVFAIGFKFYGAAVFHLVCSTVTIALLSYCLNCVSLATGGQENIKFLGGIREKLSSVAYPCLIGTISLCGFTFSCFYSRNLILNLTAQTNDIIFLALMLICMFLTALYILRVYFRVFENEYKGSLEIIKPDFLSLAAIVILTLITATVGHFLNNKLPCFVSITGNCPVVQANLAANILAFVFPACALVLAWGMYFTKDIKRPRIRLLRRLAAKRFFMDDFIDLIFSKFIKTMAIVATFIEKYILGFIFGLPATAARFLSFLLSFEKTGKINRDIFKTVVVIALFTMATVIIYFRITG